MKKTALILSLSACAMGSAFAADPATIDWSKVPATNVPLFYPGQSSYEWVRSSDHKGATVVKNNGACAACHTGKEKAIGEKIVKGGPLEPMPVKGKNGYVDLKFQAAYDAKNAYLRFQWKTLNPYAGTEHQYLRFDGKEWKVYGYPKLDKVVQEGKQPGIYEDRMSVIIDDGKVPGFATQGCWLTCHDGQRDMPKQFTKERDRHERAADRDQEERRAQVPAGQPQRSVGLEDRQVGRGNQQDQGRGRIRGTDPVARALARTRSAWPTTATCSSGATSTRARTCSAAMRTPKTHAPRFMWDEKKVGYKSITADQLRKGDHFLVREQNAVPFDPNAGWKEGDMIPDYFLSRANAKGSAADNNAIASWKDGVWTVVTDPPARPGQ